MTRTVFWTTVAILLAFPLRGAEPLAIIWDTDMDSDCDDAAALAMLHACDDRGEIKILGTMVSSKHPWSAPCTDAINTYFGRPDLPIGVPKGPGPKLQQSLYAQKLAEEFPHDIPPGDAAPDATVLYRRLLAAQPDGSVVIVTVGDLTNLRYLLESKADDASPLTGVELVRKKVKQWVCMGSRYPSDLDPKPWGNFKLDPESTVKAIEAWPTVVTFTGGGQFAELLSTGKGLAKCPKTNPVRRVYELYFKGEVKNRHSADQIATLIAIRGTGSPWKLVKSGHNHIFSDGRHEWLETPDSPTQEYISALEDGTDPRKVAATIEELMVHEPAARPVTDTK